MANNVDDSCPDPSEAECYNSSSVVHEAVIGGNLNVIVAFLNEGFDVETKDNDWHTALHQAALVGALPTAKLLVERGANINARNKWVDVPLDRAALGGSLDVATFLLEKGAEVNANEGRNAEVAALLVKRGFGRQSSNALSRAVVLGTAETVRLLLDYGAHVNTADGKRQTFLRLAVLGKGFELLNVQGDIVNPRLPVIKLLVSRGADLDGMNEKGQTGMELAYSLGYEGNLGYSIRSTWQKRKWTVGIKAESSTCNRKPNGLPICRSRPTHAFAAHLHQPRETISPLIYHPPTTNSPTNNNIQDETINLNLYPIPRSYPEYQTSQNKEIHCYRILFQG